MILVTADVHSAPAVSARPPSSDTRPLVPKRRRHNQGDLNKIDAIPAASLVAPSGRDHVCSVGSVRQRSKNFRFFSASEYDFRGAS